MKAAFLTLPLGAVGHGVMYEPPVRTGNGLFMLQPTCAGFSCLWFNQGCTIGCDQCTGAGEVFPDHSECPNPAEPTIKFGDKELRTYALSDIYRLEDYTKHHPWRYPGSAPVRDPCGIAGGWFTEGDLGNGGDSPPGVPQGELGSNSNYSLPLLDRTQWVAGSTVEVAWGITANHGGGYQYRLCPAGEELTEACFQKTVVPFVGTSQWLQYGDGKDPTRRVEVPVVEVGGDKVVPAGSVWRRNPVPPCNAPITGGAQHTFDKICTGPTFTPPAEGAWGFGPGACGSGLPGTSCTPEEFKDQNFDFGIVDKVQVPDVPPGEYVLAFRWDSEQTPQVWNSCADVTIVSSGKNTKAFSSQRGCHSCCPQTNSICSNCTGCLEDKTGACAYCWEPLVGYNPDYAPTITCLGNEAPDGGAIDWQPGDAITGGWSPGCPKCWANQDELCAPAYREFEDDDVMAV
jgi:hypothetical protein